MFELELKVDTFKAISRRDATKVLEYLGLIGGLAGALEGVFAVIGSFFSSRYLASSIASTLYVQKKSSKEIKKKHHKLSSDNKVAKKD